MSDFAPSSIGGYEVGEMIGEGGFSRVFRASKDNQAFALKLMKAVAGPEASAVIEALRYEFWVLKDMGHPAIVKVVDYGQLEDGRLYLVEELLEGEGLAAYAKGKSFDQLKDIFIRLLEAFSEVAARGVVHGDIKPDNIIMSQGQVKVVDFGFGHHTPATMAPELVMGQKPTQATDIYSLGVCFYEVLLGQNPFVGNDLDHTLEAHLKTLPENIGLTRTDVPPVWCQVLLNMVAKTASQRPRSFKDILAALVDQRFVLVEPRFVGREFEIEDAMQSIAKALEQNRKLAVCVLGPPGVGVKRYLQEIFFRLLSQDPQLRQRLQLVVDQAHSDADILLIDRKGAPDGYDVIQLELAPFKRDDLVSYLKTVFQIKKIPTKFIDAVFNFTKGNLASAWHLLGRLNDQNLLADLNGEITPTSLELVDWDRVLDRSDNQNNSDDFDWLSLRLRERLSQRLLRSDDRDLFALENLIEQIDSASMRLILKARFLVLKAECLIDESDFAAARELLVAALEIFKNQKGNDVEVYKTRNFLAYILLRQGKTQEAVDEFCAIKKEAEQSLTPDQTQAITNFDLGMAYLQNGNFDEAIVHLEAENKNLDQYPSRLMRGCYNLAQAYASQENYHQAKNNYQQCLDLARQSNDAPFMLRCFNGLGNVERQLKNWQSSLDFYEKAFELALALKDYTAACVTAQNRGALAREHGLFEQATADLKASLKYADHLQARYGFEKRIVAQSHVELGEVYAAQTDYQQAKEELDKAWHQAESDDDLKDFRFWVLLARCRLCLACNDSEAFLTDVSKLNFYAADDQRHLVDELRSQFKSGTSESVSPSSSKTPVSSSSLTEKLKTVLKINRDLVGEVNLDLLLRKILEHAIELTGAELGVLLLADEDGDLKPVLSLNADLDNDLSEISSTIASSVLSQGQSIRTMDASQDDQLNQYQSVVALHLKSILGVPILFKGKVLGVVYLSHRYRVAAFDDETTEIIEAFADQVGLALKNHQLLHYYQQNERRLSGELNEAKKTLAQTQAKLDSLPAELKNRLSDSPIVTKSPQMLEVLEQVNRIATTPLSVVVHGESGTGKELMARFIHDSSHRRQKNFMAINCGAIPHNLVESELFGHQKGAFTGAESDKIGLIEASSGGSLFLDEIAELGLEVQVKLLRVLQEREVTRVGDTKARPVDLRVIAASHQSLEQAVKDGRFREDLFYRLMGFEVHLPALRERPEDIVVLAEKFLKDYLADNGLKKPTKMSKDFLWLLTHYPWPGNIRELKNVMEACLALSEGRVLDVDAMPDHLKARLTTQTAPKVDELPALPSIGWYHPGKTWKEHELIVYSSALKALDFNVPRVATSLGVGVATVYGWLKKHRLKQTVDDWQHRVPDYEEGMKLDDIRRQVFKAVAQKYPGHPYRAAGELKVAPVTFYRWGTSGTKSP